MGWRQQTLCHGDIFLRIFKHSSQKYEMGDGERTWRPSGWLRGQVKLLVVPQDFTDFSRTEPPVLCFLQYQFKVCQISRYSDKTLSRVAKEKQGKKPIVLKLENFHLAYKQSNAWKPTASRNKLWQKAQIRRRVHFPDWSPSWTRDGTGWDLAIRRTKNFENNLPKFCAGRYLLLSAMRGQQFHHAKKRGFYYDYTKFPRFNPNSTINGRFARLLFAPELKLTKWWWMIDARTCRDWRFGGPKNPSGNWFFWFLTDKKSAWKPPIKVRESETYDKSAIISFCSIKLSYNSLCSMNLWFFLINPCTLRSFLFYQCLSHGIRKFIKIQLAHVIGRLAHWKVKYQQWISSIQESQP